MCSFLALCAAAIHETPIDQPARISALSRTDLESLPFYIRNKLDYNFKIMTLYVAL